MALLTDRDLAQITAALLERAAEEFHNHGCNEIDLREVEGLADPEKQRELDRLYHEWNGDLSEHDPIRSHAVAHDAALMEFLAEWWRSRAAEKNEPARVVVRATVSGWADADVDVLVNDKRVAGGHLGGAPEDNTYYRDYGWVDGALATLARCLGAEVKFEEVQLDSGGDEE